MSGRILLFEGRRHAEARRLLPWLVNARLDDDDQAWVAQHVAGCSECRRDVDELRLLQATYRDVTGAAAADGVDAGWRRLRARLDPAQPSVEQARRGLPQWPRWLGWAVAAQAVAIATIGIVLWRQPDPPAMYRTLGATPASRAGTLVVLFDPRVSEARLRALLLANGARIVDGPNAAGAYVLAVPPGRLAAVRAELGSAPDVLLVQSLVPEGPQ